MTTLVPTQQRRQHAPATGGDLQRPWRRHRPLLLITHVLPRIAGMRAPRADRDAMPGLPVEPELNRM